MRSASLALPRSQRAAANAGKTHHWTENCVMKSTRRKIGKERCPARSLNSFPLVCSFDNRRRLIKSDRRQSGNRFTVGRVTQHLVGQLVRLAIAFASISRRQSRVRGSTELSRIAHVDKRLYCLSACFNRRCNSKKRQVRFPELQLVNFGTT